MGEGCYDILQVIQIPVLPQGSEGAVLSAAGETFLRILRFGETSGETLCRGVF